MEDDGHPTSRLEQAPVLGEAAPHQPLIVSNRLSPRSVDDGFGLARREYTVPGLYEIIEISVVDILTKGRVSENVVD